MASHHELSIYHIHKSSISHGRVLVTTPELFFQSLIITSDNVLVSSSYSSLESSNHETTTRIRVWQLAESGGDEISGPQVVDITVKNNPLSTNNKPSELQTWSHRLCSHREGSDSYILLSHPFSSLVTCFLSSPGSSPSPIFLASVAFLDVGRQALNVSVATIRGPEDNSSGGKEIPYLELRFVRPSLYEDESHNDDFDVAAYKRRM